MAVDDKVVQRFLKKIDKSGDCWEWTAFKDRRGYGRYKVGIRQWSAHRMSWVIHNGEIPDGLFVLHKCDNPGCVRPDHLELGDQKENMRQCRERGRTKACGGASLTQSEVQAVLEAHYVHGVSRTKMSRASGVTVRTIRRVLKAPEDYLLGPKRKRRREVTLDLLLGTC